MLTGDNHITAKAVADQLGIIDFSADVLPEDKANIVKEYKNKGRIVAMVGDGINAVHMLELLWGVAQILP